MQRRRAVIVRCRWDWYPSGWPEPPQIPDGTLRDMFSRSGGLWSVAQLWYHATLGAIEFDRAELVDVGGLSGKGFDGSLDSEGNVRTPGRVEVFDAAIAQAQSQGFTFVPGDVTVVMIAPPPSPAGGIEGRGCVLDVHGSQSYMAHEFGHGLGFDHSWGPASATQNGEYGDPYCLMSALSFGGRTPAANGLPAGLPGGLPGPFYPTGLPTGWTNWMGPLPAAADVYRYSVDFAMCPAVEQISQTDVLNQQSLTLTSYGAATAQSDVVLAVIETQSWALPLFPKYVSPVQWFVEYRGAHGWDRGLGTNPPTGIVIHCLDSAQHIVYVDVIPTKTGTGVPQAWHTPGDILALTVRIVAVAPDERSAQVQFGLHAWSVRRTLAWAGKTLGGKGLRSLHDPVPSLQQYLDDLLV